MMHPSEIERKAFDLMASSIRRHEFVNTWYFGDEEVKLPFEREAKPGDVFVFRTEVRIPKDGLRWFLKVCMEGNALLKVDGRCYAGIDDVHTYVPLKPGRHEIEIVATPLTMFGYHKWRFKFEYALLVGILWEPYVLAQRMLDLVSLIESADEDLRNALIKELSDILVRVRTVPSVTQITLLRMLWHDGGVGIKELKIGRFDIRDVRPDYMFLSAVYGFGILKGYVKDILKPERARYLREIDRVGDELGEALKRLRREFPKTGKAFAFGHAHIDAAWLWNYEETKRKVIRTFSTAVRILKEYNVSFAQSSAQYYEWVEEEEPELFDEIRRLVEEGKWIPVGGMWVESDVQLVDGESLIRQFLYGQRYFLKRFGRIARIGWLPDTFGFSASLPQIMRGCGIEVFATYKLLWNERNEFPYHAFVWRGIDGTDIVTHIMMSYKASMTAKSLYQQWKMYKNKYEAPFLLYAYGYGDGGGGVTWEMAEMQRRMNEIPKIPRVVRGDEEGYVNALKGCSDRLPVWEGELYVEAHRGTYTTNVHMKGLMVEAESKLRSAEIWSTIAEILGKMRYPKEEIDSLWKRVLLHQFHDVLPGSSIKEVYDVAIDDLRDVVRRAESIVERALKAIADGRILVFNDLPWERVETIELDGKTVIVRAKPMGWCEPKPETGWVQVREEDGRIILENEYLRAIINEDGELESLFDKENEREALRGKSNVLMAHVDTPGMWDAWDVNEDFLIQGKRLETLERARISRRDGRVCEVTVVKGYGNSKLVQRIRLKAKSRLLEFETEVDWKDKEILLKAWFNFNVHNWSAFYEIPYGVIERPSVRNTPWEQAKFEVPALRWADVCDGDYGVAIICTSRHGYTNWDSKIGLSLLKSPIYPNPWSDFGRGKFTYYLYPHRGNWFEGEVYKRAMEVWSPLRVVEGRGDGGSWSLLECDCIVSLKKGEDGGYVLRIVNPKNEEIRLELPFEAIETDMLELERGRRVREVVLRPFEIKTLLFEPRRRS